MTDGSFVPLQTGNTRVFLIEGQARCDHEPDYHHQLKMMAVEQTFGDVESIFSPDPQTFGKFLTLGSVRGEEERPTTQLVGRYAENLRSTLLRLAKLGCENDLQLHMGECTDPSDFNEFDKALIIEGALIPTWSTDDLGALQPDEKAAVNETADISGVLLYEVVPLTVAERGGDVLSSIAVDVVICDAISCGECAELSDGCQKIYVLAQGPGGSPGTFPDIVYSINGGGQFFERDIDSLGVSDAVTELACVGKYLVVVGPDNDQHEIALQVEFDGVSFPTWTSVTGGYVAANSPISIWGVGTVAFIGAENGYIYFTSDPASGVSVLDAGVALTGDVQAIHAISDQFAIAGDDVGGIAYTRNQTLWQSVVGPSPGDPIGAVWAKGEDEWFATVLSGAAPGLYCSLDSGLTWDFKGVPNAGVLQDVSFSSSSIGYLVGTNADGEAAMWRSYDGGFSWNLMPDGVGVLPTADGLNAVFACSFDPNFVVGVGDLDGSDGTIMVGAD